MIKCSLCWAGVATFDPISSGNYFLNSAAKHMLKACPERIRASTKVESLLTPSARTSIPIENITHTQNHENPKT